MSAKMTEVLAAGVFIHGARHLFLSDSMRKYLAARKLIPQAPRPSGPKGNEPRHVGAWRPWTAAEIETVRTLWNGGSTAKAIAIKLGRSRSAILGRIHRMGLNRNRGGR